jgi:hypothetical protein
MESILRKRAGHIEGRYIGYAYQQAPSRVRPRFRIVFFKEDMVSHLKRAIVCSAQIMFLRTLFDWLKKFWPTLQPMSDLFMFPMRFRFARSEALN